METENTTTPILGIHLEIINNVVYLRQYNFTEEEYYESLNKAGIEENLWPNPQVNYFYSFKDIYEELYDNTNNRGRSYESDSDDILTD
jgi:hypothetical protein